MQRANAGSGAGHMPENPTAEGVPLLAGSANPVTDRPTPTAISLWQDLPRRLGRCWRFFATGFAFAAFFSGGAVLAATVFPILALTQGGKAARVQEFLRRTFVFFLWLLRSLGVLRLEMIGGERLQACRGRLIVANHPTLLDTVFLMALAPRACCIVKSEHWQSPWLGGVMRAAGYIRNDLDSELLVRQCRAVLAEGGNLIVFPEGTRSRPGEKLRFLRGFANIALLTEADIQLVVIECTPLTLTKGEPWYRIPHRQPRFRVELAHVVEVRTFRAARYRGIGSRQLTRAMESFYLARLDRGKAGN